MHLPRLLSSLAVPQAVGLLSAFATVNGVRTWYLTLERPSFTPPSWVFGPVWTLLYVLMGIALYLVWQRSGQQPVRWAMGLFAAQMALNGLWSLLFFGMRAPGFALIEIVVLLAAIVATTISFWQVRPIAGLLFVPYIAWVGFATALNAGFWWLNRG